MSEIFYRESPAFWSVEILASHGHQVVTDLARDAASSSSTMRYLLGRCMMAMERLGTHKEMGLSSPVHFATQHLKLSERLAKAILSVTKQLEELPLLAQAVLHAEIEWSQIREVVSVATLQTEELWKKLCIELNCKQIQILVAATPKGGVPGEVASKLPRKTSEYRCRFQPEIVVLIERGLQKMSKKLDKPIMFREAVERFFTEFLADKPYDEAAEKMLEEARKDFLAGRIQQEPIVLKAREVARELGLLEEVKEVYPCEGSELTESMEQAESSGQAGATSQSGVPNKGILSEETLSQETLSEQDVLKAEALEALENLQQAIGGDILWEALENGDQSPTDLSHVGKSNSIQDPLAALGILGSVDIQHSLKQEGRTQQLELLGQPTPQVEPGRSAPLPQFAQTNSHSQQALSAQAAAPAPQASSAQAAAPIPLVQLAQQASSAQAAAPAQQASSTQAAAPAQQALSAPAAAPAPSSPLEQPGASGTEGSSHVGTPNPTSTTPHPTEYDNSPPLANQQECQKTQTKQPPSKVTQLHIPSPGQFHQARFEPQAPALLNELLARLKFNPDSRFPTKAQRKALLRRDRYCCRTPGCPNHLFLEVHHVKRYSRGGKTLPQFLVTLCSRCHKNTEQGKLNIRLVENSHAGQLIFTDQHGRNLEETYRLERAIWLDYWLGWKGKETDSHWARAVGFSDSAA